MDFVVLSHLRWNFVFQRPQHLMTRCEEKSRVFFWEEPIHDASASAWLQIERVSSNLHVAVPHIPSGLHETEVWDVQRTLLEDLIRRERIADYVLWYYTPIARQFTKGLNPSAVIYDCMDELSAFRGAPAGLRAAEAELFTHADLVFTGGQSLYESKKLQHRSVHCFPSSIDRDFFETARHISVDPPDQADIPHPRLGYCGVIDERMDTDLIAAVADRRPDWQIVMLGPVVKIDQTELPRRRNIHYLGGKDYRILPSYLAGWQVGLLPFARNESTRFISPTKTPEYLAAGLAVVSTPIKDVVEPYGTQRLVEIATTPDEFVRSTERAMASRNSPARVARVAQFLRQTSWDLTWSRMWQLIQSVVNPTYNVTNGDYACLGNTATAD